jgi:CRP-like cAMP-binding protein
MPLREQSFDKGEVIVKEGQFGRNFYVIRTGLVEVLKRQGDTTIPITVLGPSEFFGEMSLLDVETGKHTATIRALEPTVVQVMTKDDFEGYLSTLTPGVRNLLRGLARRLSDTNRKYSASVLEENDELVRKWTIGELDGSQTGQLLNANATRYHIKKCRSGDVLIREGDVGMSGYIIRKGKFEVSLMIDGRKVFLNVLQERDVVGEMAIFSDNRRHATVTAITDGELLVFGKRDLLHMARRASVELFTIMDALSTKLDQTNQLYGKALLELREASHRLEELAGRVARLETENSRLREK